MALIFMHFLIIYIHNYTILIKKEVTNISLIVQSHFSSVVLFKTEPFNMALMFISRSVFYLLLIWYHHPCKEDKNVRDIWSKLFIQWANWCNCLINCYLPFLLVQSYFRQNPSIWHYVHLLYHYTLYHHHHKTDTNVRDLWSKVSTHWTIWCNCLIICYLPFLSVQ